MTFEEFLQHVQDGDSFSVDFQKRQLRVNGELIVNNEPEKFPIDPCGIMNCLKTLDLMYASYKYSLPTEFSEHKRKGYFKALKADQMTDAEMATGENREFARARLEGYILASILNGDLHWEDWMGNWFYQGADKDFVILKSWIE